MSDKINKNNKINSFQVAVIGFLISSSLFEGVASVFIITASMQNSVITASLALIIGLIPLSLIIYIINYKPEKDITQKINHLFGPIIGNFLNIFLTACVFIILVTTLWSLINFSEIKYLIETPPIFIGILFLIPVVYTSTKGIEAIARSSEILLYISLFFRFFSNFSLVGFIELNNLLPIMEKGFSPILIGAIQFLIYTLPPFFLLAIIPKSMVVDNHTLTKKITYGYLISMFLMILSLFTILTTVGPYLADLYRFPSYYVMKKIQLSGFFENLENILSVLWIINMYILICMSVYYISKHINNIFKNKKNNYNLIIIIIICILALYVKEKLFFSSVIGIHITKNFFPYLVGVPMFIIVCIICIKILYNRKSGKI